MDSRTRFTEEHIKAYARDEILRRREEYFKLMENKNE